MLNDKDPERAVIEKLGTSAAVPVSPMAKMAQVLREKAKREREDYERRVQSGEWGPAPDAGTEADHSPTHVATVEGDESQRVLHWNKDVRGFDYEPGTKLYDATALAQARQQGRNEGYEAARAEFIPPGCSVRDRGFEVDGGSHSPTLLLEFNTDDWSARDALSALYGYRQPTQKD
ncbi:hypothetical protein IMZ29_00985 [Achromobacter sp. GG226]|uniref:hypothetical protein n=1 Tax=Verticiella alkaliphila TaxID=2779529 RepID=UPI001C0CFEC1|nr:hypothetical protein [Verticiella sp. GG226]MBU4609178.1 hypothetical protein [Verticiella sp. GG226]